MPSLTHGDATERTRQLTVHSYRVDLDLTGPDTFRSTTTIAFAAADPGRGTFLDVRPEALLSVVLNGSEADIDADAVEPDDGRLPLTGLAEENVLTVVADMRWSNQCQGLHRYVDPADGRVYVYGAVFLDNAPRVFACFDQPDLKAPFTFTVTVPPDWQVLGTGAATRLAPDRWELAQPLPQATYLTTVVAGPYASVRTEHDGVPLGLHCRASAVAALEADAAEIFEVTGRCLDEFHRLFGVRYPFGSFEQVFVPEFSYLSLDHPGCVLIRELYLFTSPAPRSEHETRAVVIAHGLSLMWFAGLVTNQWWNDVWLGQAFADYLAHRVTGEVTEFDGPLTTFSARRKGQAYVADQRPSTHPVCIEGADALSALLDLDRISYFKGSSVLRQLATTVGDDRLRAGLRTYFARHAGGSATFADFLAAMGEAAGRDLTDWAKRWLMTAGVTTLVPEVTVADGVITSAAIVQTTGDGPPRPHTMDIGCHGPGHHTVRVRVDGHRTEIPELVGRPAPALLLVNEGDLTYAKTRFDAASLAALPELLPGLAPIDRAMTWCSLLLGVHDGVVAAGTHLGLVTGMLAGESELAIVVEVLEQARADVADRYLDPALRPAALTAVAAACRTRLAGIGPDDELGLALFRGLVEFGTDVAELRGWLDGAPAPAGLVLDSDLRWRIRYRLAILGELDEAGIDAAWQAERTADTELAAHRCRAALPDEAAKRAAWAAITTDAEVSSYRLWALAEGFWQPEQLGLTAPYVERFFAEMPAAARLRGDKVLDTLALHLYPRYAASPRTLDLADGLLARPDLPTPLRRRVADLTDDLRRVVQVRTGVTADSAQVGAAAGGAISAGVAAAVPARVVVAGSGEAEVATAGRVAGGVAAAGGVGG